VSGVETSYAALRDRWLTGASAVTGAPEAWRPVLAGADDVTAELRLVALAGQVWDVALRPVPPADATARPDLPPLDKPTMPDEARRWFRVVLAEGTKALWLADARGFRAHPLDWFPAASTENIPDTYLPWQDWARGAPNQAATPSDRLSDETWGYLAPGARLGALKALRAQDPGRARDLIAAHAAGEPSEVRLGLIGVLTAGLSEADVPYLTSLASDRAPKVKTLASNLLGRLGVGAAPSDDLEELAAYFTCRTTGLFHKSVATSAVPTKTTAQRIRRDELLGRFALADLAGALHVTPDDLIDHGDFGESLDGIVGLVVRTGTDAQVDRLAQRVVAHRPGDALPLMPRASRATRRAMMRSILAHRDTDADFGPWMLTSLEPDLAEVGDVVRSRRLAGILENLDATKRTSLLALSYVCTPDAARAVLDALLAAGVRPHDPWLAPLRFNLALTRSDKET